jgi:hypothetical protein
MEVLSNPAGALRRLPSTSGVSRRASDQRFSSKRRSQATLSRWGSFQPGRGKWQV